MFAKQILVPTDFSVCSKTALQLAIALANDRKDTTVVVLHVVEPAIPSFDDELGVLEPEALRTEFEALAASRDHDVQIDAQIVYGEPTREILNYADVHDVELIVMGTHGAAGLVDFLVGATAEKVMQKAVCPVLTVRADSGRTGRTSGNPVAERLLATTSDKGAKHVQGTRHLRHLRWPDGEDRQYDGQGGSLPWF